MTVNGIGLLIAYAILVIAICGLVYSISAYYRIPRRWRKP